MTTNNTHHSNQKPRRRTGRRLILTIAVIAISIAASFAVAHAEGGRTSVNGTAAAETVRAEPATSQAAELPPAPLTIGIGEPEEELQVRPPEDRCPPGTVYHEGQCLEFIPPTDDDDCPPGTVEWNGECLEFVVPDCGPGFTLVGLDCVPLTIDEPAEQDDDCPPGTFYYDGQCLEFVVPDCGPGFTLVGLECVPLTLDATPIEPEPELPKAPAPNPADGCPPGTIYHEGQCLEFEPPSDDDDCPPGTFYFDGQCLEFVVPDCGPGFTLVGLECVPLTLDATPIEPEPELPKAPAPNPADDCPPGTVYHDGQCLEFIPPTDDCPPGTVEWNGECLEFEVPDCGPGFTLVGLECVPLTLDATPIEPQPELPIAPAPNPAPPTLDISAVQLPVRAGR